MNILLIDDSFVMRKTEKEALNELKIDMIIEAANGDEAVEILEKNAFKIDLILCDVRMPVMDGEDFLHYVKKSKKFSSIPVIMCTSIADKEDVVRFLKAGAAGYILKPFSPKDLNSRIQRILTGKEDDSAEVGLE